MQKLIAFGLAASLAVAGLGLTSDRLRPTKNTATLMVSRLGFIKENRTFSAVIDDTGHILDTTRLVEPICHIPDGSMVFS